MGSGEENKTKVLRLTIAVPLMVMNARKNSDPADFTFIQLIECTEPSDKIGRVVGM